ncbi:MAG: polysulfide reductase NrfD [Desulfurococcales archaeon]|nr:polysulfide reductase NrfD [Desulfurococcales archaeon]
MLMVRQEFWGWLIAGYLFLGGTAGLVVPISYYYYRRDGNKVLGAAGGLLAFIAMVAGLALLLLDLGRPQNVLALFTSPRLNLTSWMTIGTYIISAYTIVAGVYAAGFLSWLRIPVFRMMGFLRRLIGPTGILASVLGVSTALYTGFLLAAARGVEFWNQPLMPVLFLASALSCGLCAYCAIVAPILFKVKSREFLEAAVKIRLELQRLDTYTLGFELILLFAMIDIALGGTPAQRESASLLVAGDLAPIFWVGVILVGIIIPMMIMFGYTLRRHEESAKIVLVSAVAGWLVLIGSLLLRYAILSAGIIPAPLL